MNWTKTYKNRLYMYIYKVDIAIYKVMCTSHRPIKVMFGCKNLAHVHVHSSELYTRVRRARGERGACAGRGEQLSGYIDSTPHVADQLVGSLSPPSVHVSHTIAIMPLDNWAVLSRWNYDLWTDRRGTRQRQIISYRTKINNSFQILGSLRR